MEPGCLAKALSLTRASVKGLKSRTGEQGHRPSQHPQWAAWNLKVNFCPVPKMWIKVPLKHSNHALCPPTAPWPTECAKRQMRHVTNLLGTASLFRAFSVML